VVRRVLAQAGTPPPTPARSRKVDPYLGFLQEKLEEYPRVPASVLFRMSQERGYPGSERQLRQVVGSLRPRRAAEAFLRLRTLPGEQGQIDWGHFGKIQVGRVERPLYAFVAVLSWSRFLFVRFFLEMGQRAFLQGHQEVFQAFGGVPRVLLYDNLKSAVLDGSSYRIKLVSCCQEWVYGEFD
jgi:transposase